MLVCSAAYNPIHAQSEEDILNSIGAEIEAESEANKKEEEKKEQYNDLKGKADGYFKGEKYDKAIPLYEEMSKIFPDNDYPKRQVRLINQKIKEAKAAEVKAEYDKVIAEADALFGKEKWEDAKAKYAAAAKIKGDETYPKEKIKGIDMLIAERKKAEEEAALQAKYDEFVKAGDAALADKNFEAAKRNYQQAAKVKPQEKYPKDQLLAVANAKEEEQTRLKQEAADKQYNDLITAADGLLAKEQWENAKAKYLAAQKVKPEESYPKDQIAKADDLKAKAEEAAKEAAVRKQYDDIIKQADNLLKLQNWDAAIEKYNAALAVLQDPYPTQKIKEAEQGKAEQAAAQEQAKVDAEYKQLVGVADNLFNSSKFQEAIGKYNEAKAVKPSESYPDEQITKANDAIAKAEKAAEEAEQIQAYNAKVKEADALFKSKAYDDAIAKYNEAKTIKSDETYPDTQIAAANKAKAEEAEAAAQAEALEKNYQAAMAAASAALGAKEFDEAITKFKEAAELKPTTSEPKAGLKNAEEQKKFAEAEAAKLAEAEAEKQALEQQYTELISKADAAKASEDFVNAKALYKQAGDLKPQETYSFEQITAIDAAIAAKEASEKQAQEDAAKAKEEKQAQYEQFVAAGNAALDKKEYDSATDAFNKAATLKPEASAPKEGLKAVERAKELDAAEAEKLAEQEAAEAKAEQAYKALVSEADLAFQAEDWPKAKNLYKQASSEQPDDSYPQNQLDAIEAALAQAAAQAEEAAMAEEAAKQQAEADYMKYMALGGDAMKAEDWAGARNAYEKAAEIKPSAQGPADGLVEVDRQEKLALAAKEQAQKKQKQDLENKYSGLMSKGEDALRNKEWNSARSYFTQASELKPEAFGAKERIEEVDRLEELEKMESAKAEEEERAAAEKKNEFDATMEMGNASMASKYYSAAVTHFEKALTIIPTSGDARDKLRQAKDLLSQQESQAAAAKAEADRIAAEEAAKKAAQEEAKRKAEEEARLAAEQAAAKAALLESGFAAAMSTGDDAMEEGSYKIAVEAYEEAQELKPEAAGVGSKLADARARWEKQQEELAAQRRIAEAERRKQAEIERKKAAENAEKRRQERIKRLKENSPEELAKRYPSGITEETIDQGYRTIKRTIVVEEGKGRQLHAIDYPWGLKFYYLNGKRVTSDTYKHNINQNR